MLRGIFLFEQYEIDWLYKDGANSIYPDKWDEFIAPIPEGERGDLVEAYRQRLTGSDRDEQLVVAKAWSKWEGETVTLLPHPEVIEEFTEPEKAIAVARIENHFMHHKGWFEDGQLLRDAGKLKGIPGVIVQGRHDSCTPPKAAWAAAQGVARGRAQHRPRRRPFVQRARRARRPDPRHRQVRGALKHSLPAAVIALSSIGHIAGEFFAPARRAR